MSLNRSLCTTGFFLTLAAVSVHAEHYDVYLLAGQSNAGGHGYVSEAYSYFSRNGDPGLEELGRTEYLLEQPNAIFYHWRGGNPTAARPTFWEVRTDGWIPMKAGYNMYGYNASAPESLGNVIVNHPFGAEVSFAKYITELRPGRKVAIIKYTQGATTLGATPFSGDWDSSAGRTYDISTYADAGHCYAGFMECSNTALQLLNSQGHTYTVCGMLWHQGESDAGLSTGVYKTRLWEFISAIREDLNHPEMPFIIGELIKTNYSNIRAAQRQVADEHPGVEFVSSKGMVGDSTGIHFNTMGQLLFGQRYADMLATGRLRREMLGRWALDEMAIAWNGTAYGPVSELTGQFMPGVLWGYGAESESLYVNSSVINQPGPTGDPDRAYNFTEPSGFL